MRPSFASIIPEKTGLVKVYEPLTTPPVSPWADETGLPSVPPVMATPTALIPATVEGDRERIEGIRLVLLANSPDWYGLR